MRGLCLCGSSDMACACVFASTSTSLVFASTFAPRSLLNLLYQDKKLVKFPVIPQRILAISNYLPVGK